jgi:hypothetical protein
VSKEARIEQIWQRYRRAETLPRTSWKTSYENRYREDVGYLLERVDELERRNKELCDKPQEKL